MTGISIIILSFIIIMSLNNSSNSNLLSTLLFLSSFNNDKEEKNKDIQQNNSFNNNKNDDDDDYYQRGSIDNNYSSEGKQVQGEFKKHLCGSSFEKISDYIVEYSIPYPCSQPVGIAIDRNDNAWIAATWMGHLIVFNPKNNYFTEFIEIPNWKT